MGDEDYRYPILLVNVGVASAGRSDEDQLDQS